VLSGQAFEHTFNLALHGASDGLALPSHEAASVELERCEKGPVHLPESSRFAQVEQAPQMLVRIDKTAFSRLRFRPDSCIPGPPGRDRAR
jgi:hypothetical protein